MNPVTSLGLASSLPMLGAVHHGPDLDFTPDIKTAEDVMAFAKKHGATMVDFTFVDVPGTLQHTSKPIHELEEVLKGGAGFDGSSIRGFKQIQESDMLLKPDPVTAILDPFSSGSTVSLLCDVQEPLTGDMYDSSPRTVAKRAAAHLEKSGIYLKL